MPAKSVHQTITNFINNALGNDKYVLSWLNPDGNVTYHIGSDLRAMELAWIQKCLDESMDEKFRELTVDLDP